jgi:hypothetical protein
MLTTTRACLRFLGPLLAASLATVATTGCGGSVTGLGGRTDGGPGDDMTDGGPGDDGGVDPGCPPASRVNGGASCNVSGLTCPTTQLADTCGTTARPLQCFCDGESWTCEHFVALPCAPPICPAPSQVFPGDSCNTSLGTCTSSHIPVFGCGGTPTGSVTTGTCNCTANGWSCPEAIPACAPVCPVASAVLPGGACGPIGQTCTSTNVAQMNCNGGAPITSAPCTCTASRWSCVQEEPACLPPTKCPAPDSVRSYASCYQTGLTCAGNPQYCGGDTYYDALQCNGYWVPVATTTCDLPGPAYDGGLEDAAPPIFN